jgi:hypothetical protein
LGTPFVQVKVTIFSTLGDCSRNASCALNLISTFLIKTLLKVRFIHNYSNYSAVLVIYRKTS